MLSSAVDQRSAKCSRPQLIENDNYVESYCRIVYNAHNTFTGFTKRFKHLIVIVAVESNVA